MEAFTGSYSHYCHYHSTFQPSVIILERAFSFGILFSAKFNNNVTRKSAPNCRASESPAERREALKSDR